MRHTRLCNHVFCLASQIAFRVIYIGYEYVIFCPCFFCLETLGVGAAVIVASILILLTLFNVDFVKLHEKATKACWMKIQQDKVGKYSYAKVNTSR
jgi:hypothetical protein